MSSSTVWSDCSSVYVFQFLVLRLCRVNLPGKHRYASAGREAETAALSPPPHPASSTLDTNIAIFSLLWLYHQKTYKFDISRIFSPDNMIYYNYSYPAHDNGPNTACRSVEEIHKPIFTVSAN